MGCNGDRPGVLRARVEPWLGIVAWAAVSLAIPALRGQQVIYELMSGSRLEHTRIDPEGKREITTVDLRGQFDATVEQGEDWLALDIQNIAFQSLPGPEYRITGRGGYGLSTFRGRLPAILSARFRVNINELGELQFNSEPMCPTCDSISIGGKDFPRVSFGLFQMDSWGAPEYFYFSIIAIPQAGGDFRFFHRGDFDAGGRKDVSDAASLVSFLFLSGASPPCLDAADFDDDGDLDLSDPVALLGWLFLGQAPLPMPSWLSGLDLTPDTLGCEGQESCTPAP